MSFKYEHHWNLKFPAKGFGFASPLHFLLYPVWEPPRRALAPPTHPKLLATDSESATSSPISKSLRTSEPLFLHHFSKYQSPLFLSSSPVNYTKLITHIVMMLAQKEAQTIEWPHHTSLCSPARFRMLADHFQTMYPNLNIDADGELQQLKVRTGHNAEAAAVQWAVTGFIVAAVSVSHSLLTLTQLLLLTSSSPYLALSGIQCKMFLQQLYYCF